MVPRVRDALLYCARREHLRRTIPIAFVVGVVLTAINQLDVILRGDASAVTAIKCAMNFLVPFVVSNLGLLSGRSTAPRPFCAAAPHDARRDPGSR